jgi:CheY-like chemotaxis protein
MNNDRLLNILLVEDDDDHAEMVTRSLATYRLKSRVRRVSDGEEALNYLLRRAPYEETKVSPRPDVILLDLRLPRVDGGEVLRTIRNSPELNAIPVVILTTSASEEDTEMAYLHQVNSYLVKPIDFSQFSAMLRSLGFYWLGLNAPADWDGDTNILEPAT